ncbi:TetR/AcrR family transcriptional regulator [Allostreptomyces psammosilenae]|uniref:AcrR family transcriptional regulator n=1 Tax=Allostreptomyces psammosilenae TaxID=1892865 RepID=A0A853A0V0_9ACTN|nr:TetR/AcrR family transcriptional regulator [Allostreptomyces psammosilenae]NYI07080.1 AcrR family transcriptional regulator [Allostreptomyces psammosilenae]
MAAPPPPSDRRPTPGSDGLPDLPPPPWRRGPGRPRQQLTREAIVTAALRIMGEEGLDAVTMRRVAQALNTGPASLYAHVRDKQDLHELMLDEVFKDVRAPEPDPRRWREQLKEVTLATTQVLLDHPGTAQILMRTLIPTTPGLLVIMDATLGILRAAGFPDHVALRASDALALYSTAYAYEASLWPSGEAGQEEATRRIGEIEDYLDSLPADRLPHLTALRPAMRGGDAVEHFEFALDVFIAGITAYAPPAAEPSGTADRPTTP